mgnify:CR=1 FL=1
MLSVTVMLSVRCSVNKTEQVKPVLDAKSDSLIQLNKKDLKTMISLYVSFEKEKNYPAMMRASSLIGNIYRDEAQFFDDGLVEVCNELAKRGVRVIVAGLDMDYKCVPFGPMPALLAIADEVSKVHAICVRCGNLAYVSHRTVESSQRVLLGETQEYEPLCRECYQKAIQEENDK